MIFKCITNLVSVSNQWSEWTHKKAWDYGWTTSGRTHTELGRINLESDGSSFHRNSGSFQSRDIWMSWAIHQPYFQEAKCRYFNQSLLGDPAVPWFNCLQPAGSSTQNIDSHKIPTLSRQNLTIFWSPSHVRPENIKIGILRLGRENRHTAYLT